MVGSGEASSTGTGRTDQEPVLQQPANSVKDCTRVLTDCTPQTNPNHSRGTDPKSLGLGTETRDGVGYGLEVCRLKDCTRVLTDCTPQTDPNHSRGTDPKSHGLGTVTRDGEGHSPDVCRLTSGDREAATNHATQSAELVTVPGAAIRSGHRGIQSDAQPAPSVPPGDGGKNGTRFTINLSQYCLTDAELKLLDRGMTFIPSYSTLPVHTVFSLQNRLVRNLKLKDYYREEDSEDFDPKVETFTFPSKWTPADSLIGESTLQTVQKLVSGTDELLAERTRLPGGTVRLRGSKDNLSPEERRALGSLRSNRSIVIKPADKGSATVVMDKSAYLEEARRQLTNAVYYKRLDQTIRPDSMARINGILERMNAEGSITDAQLNYLRARESDRERRFYMLPKIHKPRHKWPQPDRMPDGRPVVSNSGSESIRVAQYIDSFLRPITTRHPSYLKDTYDFVGKIRHQRIPPGAFLVTGDVTALYTNMTHERMLNVTRRQFERFPVAGRPDQHLLDLLDVTLKSNDFVFNGEWYLQICGTAMGYPASPSLANEYLEEFDSGAHRYSVVPRLYRRFIDDVFFVWTGTVEELMRFGEYLNSLLEKITIGLTWSQESVDFLDTTVYKSEPLDDGSVELLTRVYFKETDTHQLLHKQSFHPKHCARGILKSQMLRFKRIASCRRDYDDACSVLMSALSVRNYSRRLMRSVKSEVWRLSDAPRQPDTRPVLPVIVPYNELGCRLARCWKVALSADEYFGTFRLITAFTVGDNLHRKLVSSLVSAGSIGRRTNQILDAGGRGCRPCPSTRCQLGAHVTDCTSFTSCSNGKRFPINESINCRTTNLVYLITCSRCALQYVGETSTSLAVRMNNHLSCVRLRKRTPVGLHFNLPGHRLSDLTVIGIERFPANSDAEFRKTKETTWQNLLQTAYPLGLNNLKPSLLH